MKFTTLNTIVEDILKILKGSVINSSDPISKRQLEDWVHQYRAKLIAQDINKRYYANPDYIQIIKDYPLENTHANDLWRTVNKLPKTIDLRFKSGITWLGNYATREEYTKVPQGREMFQAYKRYTSGSRIAFLEDGYVFVNNPDADITAVTIKGIFENPMEVIRLANPDADGSEPYPIPNSKVTTLKEMILKGEFGIEVAAPIDVTDDSKHNPTQIITK